MKALLYSPSVPRYLIARVLGRRTPPALIPLRLVEMPTPEPPEGWVRVRVRLAGICGSDLALFFGKSSPILAPFFSFPAVPGHEILGEVSGVRVAVNPLLSCAERGLPPCPRCAVGEDGACLNVAEGRFSPGMLGYCRDLPGGWGEELVASPERIHEVPKGVPDVRAVLAEPLAVVLRGLRAVPEVGRKVLVIGAGTIGLLSLTAIKLLREGTEVHVVARYGSQARLARELGAEAVHGSVWEALRGVGRLYRAPFGLRATRGGFPTVIVAAGSTGAFSQALWTAAEGGTVLLLGGTGPGRFDLSPLWFRDLVVVGSYTYSREDFRRAVKLLPEARGCERLITHTFPLESWRTALEVLRRHRGVKAAFKPG